MSFPVDLMATKASPDGDQIEARAGVILSAGRGEPYGRMVMPDGGMIDFSDGTVSIDRLSPQTCTRLFKAAQVTGVFLNIGGGQFAPLDIKGANGHPLSAYGKPILISNPAGLCTELRKDMAWRPPPAKPDPFDNYVDLSDPHPPMEPGGEGRVDHDASGVATQCEALTRKEWEESQYTTSRYTVVRWLTTQSPRWGAVWRADIMQNHRPEPGIPGMFGIVDARVTCWRDGSTGKLARAKRPLQPINDTTTLAPLAGPHVVNRK